jgi:phosphate-selective porin
MRPRTAAVLCALAVGLAGSARAQTADPPDTPPIRIGPVLLTGYVQSDFLAALDPAADTTDTSFRFRRVRLHLSGPLMTNVSWAVSAETTTSPVLRDAYVILKHVPATTTYIGQLVMPYGYERYVTSSNRIEFTERLLSSLAPGRDAGVMVTNATPFWGWLSYGAAVVNGTGQNRTDDNGAKDVMGRLTVLPRPGLEIGVNGAHGEQRSGPRSRAGADISYETRSYHLVAEYLHEAFDGDRRVEQNGYYLLGSWKIYPSRPRPTLHHLEIATRFGEILGREDLRQFDVAVNYYPRAKMRFMFDFILPGRRDPGQPRTTFHGRVNLLF